MLNAKEHGFAINFVVIIHSHSTVNGLARFIEFAIKYIETARKQQYFTKRSQTNKKKTEGKSIMKNKKNLWKYLAISALLVIGESSLSQSQAIRPYNPHSGYVFCPKGYTETASGEFSTMDECLKAFPGSVGIKQGQVPSQNLICIQGTGVGFYYNCIRN